MVIHKHTHPESNPVDSDGRLIFSIITVVLNDATGLEKTLASLRQQTSRQYELIVVDGGSSDRTLDVLRSERAHINVVISEPDRGIYDAMNKGLRFARSEWIIFMNSGDRFNDPGVLTTATPLATDDTDVIYSDVMLDEGDQQRRMICNLNDRQIHHQAVIYRRSLHQQFGEYLVATGVTISDYLFFNLIADQRWRKLEKPIAICDVTGVSSRPMSYYQKLAIDLIFGNRSPHMVGMMLLAYPFYRLLLKPVVKLLQRIAAK
jgi:glycosyltransferase involved in cell wall biosynthesis